MADILYVKVGKAAFFNKDQMILEKHFQTKVITLNLKGKFNYARGMIRLTFFLFRNIKAKVIFARFADWYTALLAFYCKIFHKKLVVVIGGYDAVHIPEYAYGVYHRRFRSWCVRYTLREARMILPNNPTLVYNVNTYSNDYPRKEGIRHFEPNIKGEVKVIYNGYDPEKWRLNSTTQKEDIVLTVANVGDYRNFKIKGIDYFIEAAKRLPQFRFHLVGISGQLLRNLHLDLPENLVTFGRMSTEELKEAYAQSRVFCLLSLTEGMPNVLSEAMLSQCVPVGSDVNGIPYVIGDAGFIVKERKMEDITRAISRAMESYEDYKDKVYQQVAEHFPLSRRERELREAMQSLLTQ